MVGITRDLRPAAELENDVNRRSAIKHDCIRGNGPKTLPRVVKALGAQGVPVYAEVLEKCPVVKDEYPVYSCFALDALAADGSKASVAVLEKELGDKEKSRKNVALGALFRLLNTPGWRTNAQIAGMLNSQTDWEAKELMLEHVRHHKDPSARPDLEKAYAAEQDQQEKGLIKAALLELDNPGKCVMTDEGRAETGVCRYTCIDINRWFSTPKPKTGCRLVADPPAQTDQGTPPVNSASPVEASAPAATHK